MAVDVTDKTVKNTAKQWLVEVTTQIHFSTVTQVHFSTVTFLENVLLSSRKEVNFIMYYDKTWQTTTLNT